MRETVVAITVNGERVRALVDVRRTLADFIRDDCGLTGTHLGCEHGVCGACTVLLDGAAVRSCLMFAPQAHGSTVVTIEGVTPAAGLSPVQEALRREHGVQCGFCTPGFVVSITAYLRDHPDPDDADIVEAVAGNICRCTGYQGIRRAVGVAAAMIREGAP
jgi:aerobic carbon-monoxide dehydrogenase small subunit